MAVDSLGKITTNTDVPGAAAMLSSYAKLTANNSQNWSAFESIALDVLKAAYNAGREDERMGNPSKIDR